MTRKEAALTVQSTSVQVLRLPEELCIAELPALRQRIDACIDDGVRQLVLDLGATRLVTAAALRVIETADRRLANLGGELHLRNARDLPLRVLQITGFDRLVEPSQAA